CAVAALRWSGRRHASHQARRSHRAVSRQPPGVPWHCRCCRQGVAADRHHRHDASNLESVTGNTMPIRPTVLVVEDEPALRQVVVDSLESTGFAVAQAADAGDALARLEGFAYDGLVLDLRLPDGDG